ncbi:NAD(P)H-quinone oxidoreductase subunit 3 [Phycisphaerae bacterium RAS1]|nr:NAD(P)H-quinone oxidoreductase subunit 3 [Phycisphaerae bacterium RAS1]
MNSQTGYGPVAVQMVLVLAVAAVILALTHLIGPRRTGAVKQSTYESGMNPVGDTRRRFNVRFYIVAMLFLLFDVEIVFFYPWAVLFPQMNETGSTAAAAWARGMEQRGFGHAFFLLEMLIFVAILLVGYVYAWRKGVFRWD